MKLITVAGARPNFMKVAPFLRALLRAAPEGLESLLVHTGQHYGESMSEVFFRELGIPSPDINLAAGSGTHAEQTARILVEFERTCMREKPDLVVVVGDVNSTLACALAAAKLQVPVAHIEAGLRSFDRSMPEEINRLVVDALSTFLFTTSPEAEVNLLAEGVAGSRIHHVGNVMVDSVHHGLGAAALSDVRARIGLTESSYAFVTLHRPSNVDDPASLALMIDGLERVSAEVPVVFAVHPRTRAKLEAQGRMPALAANPRLKLIDPVGYVDCLSLMTGARLVITDSGGLQEESTALGVPCLTARENTERPITVSEGTNTIVGRDIGLWVAETRKILAGGGKAGRVPALWDGKASERIVEVLLRAFRR